MRFLYKGILAAMKAPKTSQMLLWTAMFVFIIFVLCLKQISTPAIDNLTYTKRVNVKQTYLHYLKPESFSISRNECVENPVGFFVILSNQRSGSGWFESLLNSHINASSNGEVFSVRERRMSASSIIHTLDRVYNLDWFSTASKNHCSAAIGLKWMLNQGVMKHHKKIAEYFYRRSVFVIFLFRRNLLCTIVSILANSYDHDAKQIKGTHKSHVHSAQEADILSNYKPLINSTSLLDDLKDMEIRAAKALEHFSTTRHMILYYEDLMKNHSNLKDVQDSLGLPVMELKSRQVKINKGPLSDHIKNWDEVNKTLTGTVYESFLEADY